LATLVHHLRTFYLLFIGHRLFTRTRISYFTIHLGRSLVLTLHGVGSAFALMAFGTVLPFHIKAGLKSQKNLISGISQLAFLSILVVTALLLYYGPEEIHEGTELTHWIIGLVFFAFFLFHIINRTLRK